MEKLTILQALKVVPFFPQKWSREWVEFIPKILPWRHFGAKRRNFLCSFTRKTLLNVSFSSTNAKESCHSAHKLWTYNRNWIWLTLQIKRRQDELRDRITSNGRVTRPHQYQLWLKGPGNENEHNITWCSRDFFKPITQPHPQGHLRFQDGSWAGNEVANINLYENHVTFCVRGLADFMIRGPVIICIGGSLVQEIFTGFVLFWAFKIPWLSMTFFMTF